LEKKKEGKKGHRNRKQINRKVMYAGVWGV